MCGVADSGPSATVSVATRIWVRSDDRNRPLKIGISWIQTVDEATRSIVVINGRRELISGRERRTIQLGAIRLL